jgi:hypothetical protein
VEEAMKILCGWTVVPKDRLAAWMGVRGTEMEESESREGLVDCTITCTALLTTLVWYCPRTIVFRMPSLISCNNS